MTYQSNKKTTAGWLRPASFRGGSFLHLCSLLTCKLSCQISVDIADDFIASSAINTERFIDFSFTQLAFFHLLITSMMNLVFPEKEKPKSGKNIGGQSENHQYAMILYVINHLYVSAYNLY